MRDANFFSFANLGYAEAWGLSVAEDFENDSRAVELGASPAELDYNVDQERPRSWATGDHEAELRLNDTVYDC